MCMLAMALMSGNQSEVVEHCKVELTKNSYCAIAIYAFQEPNAEAFKTIRDNTLQSHKTLIPFHFRLEQYVAARP